ncbi:hypothetical protein G3578_04740 [Brevibacillus sp. SYP-B805]|jgi:hypothetical protein|uniref:hypothetical protein n=1 Tax=Brevibacillus sp. SYP-B805 TaxID=1578199 RepID=UPI0013EDF9BB|nr:hypothetical protein [Brevibacillus sp. SYP-B805]NGQ94485.1 hypothetical protein [Brevibacillus sp. SYP-B805]
MLGALYLTCALLLVVWLVVELLFRFIEKDTLKHDLNHLWEQFRIKPDDFWYYGKPGKKQR